MTKNHLKTRTWRPIALGLLLAISQGACSNESSKTKVSPITLRSTSVAAGVLQRDFTCDGSGNSPELSWQGAPVNAESLALLVTDKDSVLGLYHFPHWIIYNLTPNKVEIPESFAKQHPTDGTQQGANGYGEIGYVAPCPPWGAHRYLFDLYALDRKLNLPLGASKQQLLQAMKGHILSQGELTARYRRK